MGKKNRENNTTKKSLSSIRQQDETFEYLTKTFNSKDGPNKVYNFYIIIFFLNLFLFLIKAMCDVTRPHVDSFNWMLKEGLMKAATVRRKKKKSSHYIFFFLYSPFYH